jgi:hypothetical protein
MAHRNAGPTPKESRGACHVHSHPTASAPRESRRQQRGVRMLRPKGVLSRPASDALFRPRPAAWRYEADLDRPLPTGRACVMRSAASPSPDACSGEWSAAGKTCRPRAESSRGRPNRDGIQATLAALSKHGQQNPRPLGAAAECGLRGRFGFFGATAPPLYRRGLVGPSACRENQRRATCRLR